MFFDPENVEFTDSPIHILIGEIDDWTPAEPCNFFVKKISKTANVDLTIYPDSHHSFDKNSPVIRNEEAYNFSDCIFKMTSDGKILMNYFHH